MSESPAGLVKTQVPGSHLQGLWFRDLLWTLKNLHFLQVPCAADHTGFKTRLQILLLFSLPLSFPLPLLLCHLHIQFANKACRFYPLNVSHTWWFLCTEYHWPTLFISHLSYCDHLFILLHVSNIAPALNPSTTLCRQCNRLILKSVPCCLSFL